jgi:DNA-directed RNA polymerase subunit delta
MPMGIGPPYFQPEHGGGDSMNVEEQTAIDANMNMEDIVFRVLKQTNTRMHYKELVHAALEVKKDMVTQPENSREAASILTAINMDGRFVYWGNGLWGLRQWRGSRNRAPEFSSLADPEFDPLEEADEELADSNEFLPAFSYARSDEREDRGMDDQSHHP